MEERLQIDLRDGEVFDLSLETPAAPSGGTSDYLELANKPRINAVELIGDKSLDDLDIQQKGDYPQDALTNTDIERILNNFV